MTILPEPSSFALKHSEKLKAHIRQDIEAAGGLIDFARFMELALYAPGLGYYTSGTHKLGRAGDFVTAPELSPLFAACMAKQFQEIFKIIDQKNILEFGAGSGIFARDVLFELEKLNGLPEHYYILEVSADLRERQLLRFKTECPQFLSRIVWLDALPKSFNGIMFANEVLDAMPVHRFEWHQGEITECFVGFEQNQFVFRSGPSSDALKKRVLAISENTTWPDFYSSEISLIHPAWIKSLADCLEQGVILLVDYGYGRREYYHPERQQGTLTCFYQHHRHADPLILPGLQDITAHVDFTTIADSADEAGLSVSGFTTQAAFLLACGMLDIAQKNPLNAVDRYKQNQIIKTLTLPSEMGEVVKVMALSRKMEMEWAGFLLKDRRPDLTF
ncbi:MAG TPA: SAM-dependent methyltransferase [Gammaproteobacteria bacterium]|nr:SAM-dependent methyltransferase [Gammaproteobacteria bacterium]